MSHQIQILLEKSDVTNIKEIHYQTSSIGQMSQWPKSINVNITRGGHGDGSLSVQAPQASQLNFNLGQRHTGLFTVPRPRTSVGVWGPNCRLNSRVWELDFYLVLLPTTCCTPT